MELVEQAAIGVCSFLPVLLAGQFEVKKTEKAYTQPTLASQLSLMQRRGDRHRAREGAGYGSRSDVGLQRPRVRKTNVVISTLDTQPGTGRGPPTPENW